MNRERSLRVLVIDDSAEFCRLMELVFGSAGCLVDATTSPYAGITCSNQTRYDLVMVDQQMAGMDGLGVVRHILPRGHRCILMVTAGSAITVDEARAAGAAGIIWKPVELQRIQELVEHLSEQTDEGTAPLPPSWEGYVPLWVQLAPAYCAGQFP